LDIRVLGPLEVLQDGLDVTPRRKKERALLAVLALRPGELASADRLVDELWGESPPKTARHALENYVSELRQRLGRELIQTRAGGYVLDVEPGQVDLMRFETHIAASLHEAPAQRAKTLELALSMLRGEPLADLAFEPFALRELARIQELELTAREDLIQAKLELGRHLEVVPAIEPLVSAYPFRERLRGQLMVALYRSGRQAEALAAYQQAREVLVEELGIDPSKELQDLERAILRQDPDLEAPARRAASASLSRISLAAARGPSRKTVTVLFAGLADLGTLAESLDPEVLRAVLDRYVEAVHTGIERHGGTLATVVGDEVLAVFGAPTAHEDDPMRAVRAAFDVRSAIGVLNDALLPQHGVFLELRAAVETGEVLVGDGGESPTGPPVARARDLARGTARSGQIILGDRTHNLVRGVVEAESVAVGESDSRSVRLVSLVGDAQGRALRLDSPLVGRRRQLSALEAAFERAVTERRPQLVTVLGPAGVGKSRLAGEFIAGLRDVAGVRHGRCLPYGVADALGPLAEALGDFEPEEGAIRERLTEMSRERPLVIELDDLQWAAPELLDLVETFAASLRDAPILVVCIARSELLESRPTWPGGQGSATSLVLEPLSVAESERLVDNLLGESDLPDSLRDYVIDAADGLPLFVEELLASLVDREVLRMEGGRWTSTAVPSVEFPPTIQALIMSRMDRLTPEERAVIEVASVQGKVFEEWGVAAVAPAQLLPHVDSSLNALVRKEIIRPTVGDAGEYAFRHQLVRDVVYSSVSHRRRSELHDGLADRAQERARGCSTELVRRHRDEAMRNRSALELR
jgi:DNA-binding SARP family transcriptional activator